MRAAAWQSVNTWKADGSISGDYLFARAQLHPRACRPAFGREACCCGAAAGPSCCSWPSWPPVPCCASANVTCPSGRRQSNRRRRAPRPLLRVRPSVGDDSPCNAPAAPVDLAAKRLVADPRGLSSAEMVASDSFAEFLREQLAPLGRVTMRRMFGKTGVFCDGVMLGMVTDNMLYLRIDDHNREAFQEAASSPPLSYEKKGSAIDLSFWRAPERLFDEPDELVTWARLAMAAARRVAAKRGRTVSRRKPRP
jgi:DNA transformation protein and related proteins